MSKIWILVANASEAKLFGADKIHGEWALLNEWIHPESREKDLDLVSDRPGHYSSRDYSRGAYEDTSEPKRVEADNFAQKLVHFLDQGRMKQEYAKLILVATPHFHGLLNKHNNPHVAALVTHQIEKDYTKLTLPELKTRLAQEM